MPGARPDLVCFIVDKKTEDDAKGFWREVGAAWFHQAGRGVTVRTHKGMAVYGDIVCVERKDAERPAETAKPRASGPKR